MIYYFIPATVSFRRLFSPALIANPGRPLMRVTLLLLIALLGTASTVARTAPAPPTLVASVEPLAMVLRQLYGEHARVVTLLEANQSPHHPMLSPRQILTLRQADLLVWLGADAEPAVAALVKERDGPSLALLDLPGVVRREGGHDHDDDPAQHGHDHHEHDHHGQVDPHLWLDPDNMAALARALGERQDPPPPAGQPAAFLAALAASDATIRAWLAPLQAVPWLTYHHPWAYFQRHFGLRDPVIVSERLGAGPSSRRFVALAATVKQQGLACAVVEPEAQADLLRRLCPACRLRPLDPLGRDHSGGYTAWLEGTATALRECLGPA
tara:strand:- start:36358 stop:37335 length:978 start_codon:yes stop_codon:yes gene_type:complete